MSNVNQNEIGFVKRNETLIFSTFPGKDQNETTRDFTEDKITFIWLRVLTDVLVHMPKLKKEARSEMIDVCRQECKNVLYLKHVDPI